MLQTQYFLGIDVGTSAIKLLLMDEQKNVVVQQSVEYEIDHPYPGWREINPEVWFESFGRGMEQLLQGIDPSAIEAIGVTGQMHTLVMLDEQGGPLRPAILWDDTRTRELVPVMRQRLEGKEGCEGICRTLSTGSPAVNLYWLKQMEPERYARLKKFLIGPDYIVYRLTGNPGTDYCMASTSCLYDIENRQWSPEVQKLLELPETVYPQIRGSAQSTGTLTAEMAERFGLRAEVKVLAGSGDNAAAALCSGCLGEQHPVISLGTSGILMYQTSRLRSGSKGKRILFSHDGEQFCQLVQGALQANGSSLEWWLKAILKIEDVSSLDRLLEGYIPQMEELLFFPHLKGEKTLFADPAVRGAFLGLCTEASREDLMHAVLQGLCLGYRQLAEEMGLDLQSEKRLRVVGGGARSEVWMQTLSDVLGVAVEQMDGAISPAFGVALLAAYHCGKIASFQTLAHGAIRVRKVFEPSERLKPFYDRKYARYQRIYPALKALEVSVEA